MRKRLLSTSRIVMRPKKVLALLASAAAFSNPWLLSTSASAASGQFAAYEQSVLSSHPAAFYPLNESGGTVATDASGNANNATYAGTVAFGHPGVFSDASSTSVGVNGDNGYVSGPDLTPLQGSADRTVEVWFKGSGQGTLLHAGVPGHTQSFDLTVLNGGPGGCGSPSGPGLYLRFWDDDLSFPGLTLTDGAWHYLAVTVASGGSVVTVDIDGQEPPAYVWNGSCYTGSPVSQPFTMPFPLNTGSGPFGFGQDDQTGLGGWVGDLALAAIYPSALSTTTLHSHFALGFASGPPQPRIVALGDSYIAGEGTYSANEPFSVDYYGGEQGGAAYPQSTISGFNPDSASASDRCHRSPAAYAPLIGVKQPDFVACSSATISIVEQGSAVNGEKSQLLALNAQDTVVLLSIGGDDLGFTNVLDSCVDGPFGKHQSTDPGCHSAIQQAQALIPTMQSDLYQLLGEIRAAAPNAVILQVGYPRLFPQGGTGSTCSGINNKRQGWLNTAADQVDSAIAATDASANASLAIGQVNFVDPRLTFAQHELCSGTPFLNDLQLLDAHHFGPITVGPNNCPSDYTARGTQVCSQSFHPNTFGYLAETSLVASWLPTGP